MEDLTQVSHGERVVHIGIPLVSLHLECAEKLKSESSIRGPSPLKQMNEAVSLTNVAKTLEILQDAQSSQMKLVLISGWHCVSSRDSLPHSLVVFNMRVTP